MGGAAVWSCVPIPTIERVGLVTIITFDGRTEEDCARSHFGDANLANDSLLWPPIPHATLDDKCLSDRGNGSLGRPATRLT